MLPLALAACAPPTSSRVSPTPRPNGGHPVPVAETPLAFAFEPPASYQAMWDRVVRCSGIKVSMAEALPLGFRKLEAQHIELTDGTRVGAFYVPLDREIWIASYYQDSWRAVGHEMLHAVLATRGITGHPARYFKACGLTETIGAS